MNNIESILIAHLAEVLDDITVSGDVPNPRPDWLVTIERTGGRADSIVIDRPTIAVQCWAPSRVEASALAYRVDAAMRDIDDVRIPSIERAGLYNFPDGSGNPRYQITYDIVAYIE